MKKENNVEVGGGIFDAKYLKFYHLVVVLALSYLVFINREANLSFKDLSVGNLYVLVWAVALLLPFFSDIEIMGMKFKREIQADIRALAKEVAKIMKETDSLEIKEVKGKVNLKFSQDFKRLADKYHIDLD